MGGNASPLSDRVLDNGIEQLRVQRVFKIIVARVGRKPLLDSVNVHCSPCIDNIMNDLPKVGNVIILARIA